MNCVRFKFWTILYKRKIFLSTVPFRLISLKTPLRPIEPFGLLNRSYLSLRAQYTFILKLYTDCLPDHQIRFRGLPPSCFPIFQNWNVLFQWFLWPRYKAHMLASQLPKAWMALANLMSLAPHLSFLFEGQTWYWKSRKNVFLFCFPDLRYSSCSSRASKCNMHFISESTSNPIFCDIS